MHLNAALPSCLLGLLVAASTTLARGLPIDADAMSPQIEYTKPASCSRPTRVGDKISVDYRGRLQSNNVEFDESYKRGKPFTFTLGAGEVIKGYDQGLLDMCPGEGRTLIIPPELGYGDHDMGAIPPHSTLIFDIVLVDIAGVKQDGPASPTEEGSMTIATAPATPGGKESQGGGASWGNGLPEEAQQSNKSPDEAGKKKECRLLGPFALLVQGALGGVAVLSLVWKRYKEVPKRPWKIFIFDVSKQVLGSMLTHIVNLMMSMTGSVAIMQAAQKAAESSGKKGDGGDRSMPNPCSFYLLNLGIDTTIGIFVLFVLLKVLHALFLRTPLANPPQSISSGNYDTPPRTTWWAKQLLIYCIGLLGMKLFVFFLLQAMPWLPWVGDWALRWTKGNEALEITFAMFIFPLAMNAVQYWVIDNLIKDNQKKDKGYEQVQEEDDDDEPDTFGQRRDLDGSFPEDQVTSSKVDAIAPEDSAFHSNAVRAYEEQERRRQ